MATLPERQFAVNDAKREHVPLLIGLTGPSGGGKTYSALRLATGIQTVTGGDIYFIDTESRRALHYADQFKFKHVPFDAPFGSLDYLAALQFCVKQGAKVVIVDSMSHEHEGPGGLIDLHETILTRLAGDDYRKREAMKMLAWSEPKQKRRQLINGILQLNANFIFCFRAKNTAKPIKVDGKTKVEQLGYMPIAGEEFVFEQTLNCLLLPGAGGRPTWHSEERGEQTMIKLPEQFKWLEGRSAPLDEKVGGGLARWAAGMEKTKQKPRAVEEPDERQFEATDAEPDADDFGELDDDRSDESPPQVNDTGRSLADQIADTPAERKVAEIKAELVAAKSAKKVEEIVADYAQHKDGFDNDQRVSVEVEISKARDRIGEPSQGEMVK